MGFMATKRSISLLSAAMMLLVGACSTPAPDDVAATQAPNNSAATTQASPQSDAPQSDTPQAGKRERRRIDFAAAAQKLGVTETQLKEALGRSPQPSPSATDENGRPIRRRLDIKGAARS